MNIPDLVPPFVAAATMTSCYAASFCWQLCNHFVLLPLRPTRRPDDVSAMQESRAAFEDLFVRLSKNEHTQAVDLATQGRQVHISTAAVKSRCARYPWPFLTPTPPIFQQCCVANVYPLIPFVPHFDACIVSRNVVAGSLCFMC